MSESEPSTVTQLLARVRAGDGQAFDELYEVVYDEMRRLAHAQRRRWDGENSLTTTSLVHEVYLKLGDQASPSWKDRAHFMAVASRAMRHLLIDHARHRDARKRGGGQRRVSFDQLESALADSHAASTARDQILLALDDALNQLTRENGRLGVIVECRFFGRMTIDDTAEALGISPATVKRGWAAALAWLYRNLRHSLNEADEHV